MLELLGYLFDGVFVAIITLIVIVAIILTLTTVGMVLLSITVSIGTRLKTFPLTIDYSDNVCWKGEEIVDEGNLLRKWGDAILVILGVATFLIGVGYAANLLGVVPL